MMIKLGARIALLLGLVVAGCFAVIMFSFNPTTPKYSYLGGIQDKHARLRAIGAPRLIFVGGSGLAFGVDSPRVEQELGTPVVNMALHAALGLRYMLTEVEPGLKPGDIVIISGEYDQFYGYFDGKETLLDLLFVFPQGLGYFSSPGQFATVVEGFPISMQEMFQAAIDRRLFGSPPPNPVYRRDAFNPEGDVVSHLNRPVKDVGNLQISLKGSLDHDAVKAVGDFARSAESKGIRTFYLFPALPTAQYQKIQHDASELCRALQAQGSLTLLAAPGDYTFPADYFFDTVYHLNREGRAERTKRLIADLKQALSAPPTMNCDLAVK